MSHTKLARTPDEGDETGEHEWRNLGFTTELVIRDARVVFPRGVNNRSPQA